MNEETKVEKESTQNNPVGSLLIGAISKMVKNKFLEELEKQQAEQKPEILKLLGKKFEQKLNLARENQDIEAEKKLLQEAINRRRKTLTGIK